MKILSLLLVASVFFTLLSCRDDPIPDGIPTAAVLVQVQMNYDQNMTFDRFKITVDNVQIVHRTNANDPTTEKIYDVNYETTSLTMFNENELYIIGQYEVPVGVIMQVRYRIIDSEIIINGTSYHLTIPSAEKSGLKFIPELTPSPFMVKENQMFAIQGTFIPKERIIINSKHKILKPTIPSKHVPLENEDEVFNSELVLTAHPGTPLSTVEADTKAYKSKLYLPTDYDIYRVRLDPSTTLPDAYYHYQSRPWVKAISRNYSIKTTAIIPPGETITTPQMTGNYMNAWQRAVNKMGTVGDHRPIIAILDTGVDLRNRDIINNLFINMGEISHIGIIDVDLNGFITINDINDPANIAFNPGDLNGNGYLDGQDILTSPIYSDGIDQDSNGYIDDIFGWDFVDMDNNPMDGNGHGTTMAGIASGANDGNGILGTTHNARVIPIRIMDNNGSGKFNTLNIAMHYVIESGEDNNPFNNIDIVNMSFAGTWQLQYSDVYCNRCRIVSEKEWEPTLSNNLETYSFLTNAPSNIIWVVGAGNNRANIGYYEIYQAVAEPIHQLIPDRSFIVTGVDNNGLYQRWVSKYNNEGSNYGSVIVDMSASGVEWLNINIGSGWPVNGFKDGTSQATATVSGGLALLISMNPIIYQGNAANLKRAFFDAAPPYVIHYLNAFGSGVQTVQGDKFMDLDVILANLGFP